MSIKALDEQLNRWWDLDGFGYVPDVKFGPYGCEARFSCSLFGGCLSSSMSLTPVSDTEERDQWLSELAARGFVLGWSDREAQIIDCDQSRNALCALIRAKIPSAEICSFENINMRGLGFVLRSVTVFIRSISEISSLPVPQKDE